MIIDSHVHFGNSSWGNFSIENVLDIVGDSIDIAICSNLEGIDSLEFKTELECNIHMLDISKKYDKIKPLYVCQPNSVIDFSITERFLTQNKEFIGLKFHPECMKLPANDVRYNKYLSLAQKINKPCLFHSGHIKSRFSSPKLIYEKACEFPNLPIILGHLSTGPKECHREAVEILIESIIKNSATLYVDISWMDFAYERLNESYEETLYLIDKLKNTPKGDFTHRILWGSDAPVGAFNHSKDSYQYNLMLFKKKVLDYFNDIQLLEKLLYKNAKDLYKI